MEKRKVLGRGLETLLPARKDPPPSPVGVAPAPLPSAHGESIHQISLDLVDRNPYQTRSHVDEAALEELAASVRASGVLQPITVRPAAGGRFQLIAGERRWLASQRAGKATVPAIVRQVSDEQAMEMTIIENLQREDLNPMEQARAFERLGREFGLTQEDIARKTGKDRTSVTNFLRLLKMPAAVQSLIESNQLTLGHAKALMPIDSPEAMEKVAQRVAAVAMSVRQTEQAVANLMHPMERVAQVRQVDPNVKNAESELERRLGVRVTIADRNGKGKVVLEYESLEDFDRILEALTG